MAAMYTQDAGNGAPSSYWASGEGGYGGGGRGGHGGSGGGGFGGYGDKGCNGGNGGYRGVGGYGSGGRGGSGGGCQGDRGSGGGRGGSVRDGGWICPNPGCWFLNFAGRVECNKCGAPVGACYHGGGVGGNGRGGSRGGVYDEGRSGNYGGGRGNNYNGSQGSNYEGRSGGGRGGFYGGNQGGDYGQFPSPFAPQSYGRAEGNYPPSYYSYEGNPNYETQAVPSPTGHTGGPISHLPSDGGLAGGYGGDNARDAGVVARAAVEIVDVRSQLLGKVKALMRKSEEQKDCNPRTNEIEDPPAHLIVPVL